jgi:hypothetical protein
MALWLAACGAGLLWVLELGATPGVRGVGPPEVWPVKSTLAGPSGRARLLLFLHPRCPCSTATVGELERLVAECHGRLDVTALFIAPEGTPPGWTATALRERVEAIPGVSVIVDELGIEASRFGATTSGATRLYDEAGVLVFHGGITRSRGHEGDNAGRDAITAFAHEGAASAHETPVFGCSLWEEAVVDRASAEKSADAIKEVR